MANDILQNYISSVSSKYAHEETSEMGYRTDFELLLKGIFESINVSRFDHDARAKQGNKPDFVVLKNDVPILYIETKDIGVSLDKIEKSEQMSRYFGYANLVLTDYVEFRFYRNGLPYGEPIKIAEYSKSNRTINPLPNNFDYLAKTLVDFTQSHKEPIKSGKHLSKIMGGKAQRIRDNVRQFLSTRSERNAELVRVYETIKKLLVHDLSEEAFADMYAQTLVYGLFVARFYDDSPKSFSRQEARDLIPASNPLLRHFFDHIVGPNFDKRLEYIVNELCEVFSHADVEKLMKEYFQEDLFGTEQKGPDPVIHFYEDFLKEYDPELRKRMGAYYTPLPVVMFITRSVDHLLKNVFKLSGGLADTSKTASDLHRVQVLDPAVGTGTFISAVLGVIYSKLIKSGQQGRWPKYVHNDLLPRIHGFELMMAPYTIAHLKLAMAFRERGFKYFNRRLGIYLTNSLEETTKQEELFTAFGLAESIAEESKEAAIIKNKTPIMVVIGNPPYSGESSNAQYKGNDVYKVEPGGGKLQEKNSKWLNDDYVKFIRLAESMVERTGEGIVAMITPHGYIDNPTFRGMRWHLMKTFDEIYVLDLHGNTNKKEKSPDGTEDKNVFDIKTGVAIFFGIKKKESKTKLAKVYQADLYGKRPAKFKYLNENLINSVKWTVVTPSEPGYEWVKRDEELLASYNNGFSVDELFLVSSVGIVTARDAMSIQDTKAGIEAVIQDFLNLEPEILRMKYSLGKDVRDWKVNFAKKDVIENFDDNRIKQISYRPFNKKWTFYTGNSKGFHCMPRGAVMRNLLGDEISLVTTRQVKAGDNYCHALVAKGIVESTYVSNKTSEIGYVFPLFSYQDDSRISNLNTKIVNKIQEVVGNTTPEKIFDYVYAVLYSPAYREKYKGFLKANFPRISYPTNEEAYGKLASLGRELRQLHLLESSKLNAFVTTYPESGSDLVEKLDYREGKVFINNSQYFGNVSELAWNFWIGGYQPAQKWLKDRKGKTLTNSDIEHYQKIIVALTETAKVMKEIDAVIRI